MPKKKYRNKDILLLTIEEVFRKVGGLGGEISVNVESEPIPGKVAEIHIKIFNPKAEWPDNSAGFYVAGRLRRPFIPWPRVLKALRYSSLIPE